LNGLKKCWFWKRRHQNGEAAEFDYSGSQCLKALKEEGIETVLINPNNATIQTDPRLSGKVYLLPVTIEYVEKLSRKNAPTASCWASADKQRLLGAIELVTNKSGILEKYQR
jgi:carbamoyl-phosphate synthase large subunit